MTQCQSFDHAATIYDQSLYTLLHAQSVPEPVCRQVLPNCILSAGQTSIDALGLLQERAVAQAVPASEEAPPAELVNNVLSNSYQRRVPGTGDMRHGSEGWHALETSCKVVLAHVLILPSCHAYMEVVALKQAVVLFP